jgi:N4-gp56 family major capsid protein
VASTSVQVNDPLACQAWAKRLMVEALKATIMDKFVGRDDNSLIQIRDELKDGGSKVTWGLRMQLKGGGTIGDNVLSGREEALTRYSDSMIIDQLRHGVLVYGNMSAQRVLFDMRAEAKSGLADWLTDRADTWFFNQLAGNTIQDKATTDIEFAYTGMQPTIATDTNHWIISNMGDTAGSTAKWDPLGTTGKETTLNGIGPKGYFALELIDACVQKAKTLSPAIRPINLKGQRVYVMFLHPYQVTDLRAGTTASLWHQIQQNALAGGQITGSPYFNGALGMYHNVILHEDVRVPFGASDGPSAEYGTNLGTTPTTLNNVARAIFCGAQSGFMAFGRQTDWPLRAKWFEELIDYGNQFGVSISMIAGLKKAVFNAQNFGAIIVSTCSPGTIRN